MLHHNKLNDVANDKLKALKFNLIGSCYYVLGRLYEKESEKAYCKAINKILLKIEPCVL
jgi:hypothetical protein